MDSRLWGFIDTHIRFPGLGVRVEPVMETPLCDHCKQEVIRTIEHEYCHLDIPTPKIYEDYVMETDYSRLLDRYGAPPSAQPPIIKQRGKR